MLDGYEKAESFTLGNSISGWGEDFVQRLVNDDPSVLGLGDLEVKEREKRQIGAGRLDFLLRNPQTTDRYTVEIQLGPTNPSHIIRTIEYWDREQKTSPQYKHMAVIVAEEITARFFNVISLFNQHIPLIAIKMNAISVGGKRTIVFTKILDHTKRTYEDEDAGVPETDRRFWEDKTSAPIMSLLDEIVLAAKTVDPQIAPKYNKNSIPLKHGTEFWRIVTLRPKKKFIKLGIPSAQSSEIENKLNSAEIDFDGYDELRHRYVLTLVPGDLPKHKEIIASLIAVARSQAGLEEGAPDE